MYDSHFSANISNDVSSPSKLSPFFNLSSRASEYFNACFSCCVGVAFWSTSYVCTLIFCFPCLSCPKDTLIRYTTLPFFLTTLFIDAISSSSPFMCRFEYPTYTLIYSLHSPFSNTMAGLMSWYILQTPGFSSFRYMQFLHIRLSFDTIVTTHLSFLHFLSIGFNSLSICTSSDRYKTLTAFLLQFYYLPSSEK